MRLGTLEWNPNLAIDAGSVDDAHRELLDLYNRIVYACENNGVGVVFRERIRTFLMYARWHFLEEEALMRRLRYPGYADHRAHHQRLLQDAEDFLKSLGEGLQPEDGSAIASYFKHWLTRHLHEKDARLRDFLKSETTETVA